MRAHNPLIKFLSIGLLLLAACSSAPKGSLVRGSEFNADTLNAGGIAVAGVVATAPAMTVAERMAAGEQLSQLLRSQRPELAMADIKMVEQALGKNLYQQMLDSYRFHGVGSAAFMNIIEQKLPHRYALFVRITQNVVQRNSEPIEQGVTLYTSRLMVAEAILYDFAMRQRLVWQMSVSDKVSNSQSLATQPAADKLADYFPSEPAIKPVLANVLAKVVAALP